ncbi:MAG: hypothetical protein Q9221_006320 [Calogaya cf. arnoldii]
MIVDSANKNVLETRTEEEILEGVRAKMLDAVRVRLQADVPVGIHLSGGIDSAVIAGMAKHLLDQGEVRLGSNGDQHLKCLGIAFDEGSGYDESDWQFRWLRGNYAHSLTVTVIAQNTANFLGVDFQKTHMNESKLAANFEEAVWFDEQPHFELGFVGKHVLSKLTQDSGLKTVISGQGSDEIFGGYDVYLRDYLREPDLAWPNNKLNEPTRLQKLQESTTSMTKSFDTWTGHDGNKIPPHPSSKIPTFASAMAFPHLFSSSWVTQQFGSLSPQVTMIENIDVRVRDHMRTKWHPLHSAQYVWNKTALPNMLLTNLSDRTEMSHSIEGRVPFLDHHLIQYVNGLPPSMKIRYDPETGLMTEKWILRQASRPFITEELYTRKKHVSSPLQLLPPPLPSILHLLHLPTSPFPASTNELTALKTALLSPNNLPPQRPHPQANVPPHHPSSISNLGFISWEKVKDLVETAFTTQDRVKLRSVFGIAQWVVLGERFGVPRAGPIDQMMGREVGGGIGEM